MHKTHRLHVTAVPLPGLFLGDGPERQPVHGADAGPPQEPPPHGAAGESRQVSTDEPRLGLDGFCWDPTTSVPRSAVSAVSVMRAAMFDEPAPVPVPQGPSPASEAFHALSYVHTESTLPDSTQLTLYDKTEVSQHTPAAVSGTTPDAIEERELVEMLAELPSAMSMSPGVPLRPLRSELTPSVPHGLLHSRDELDDVPLQDGPLPASALLLAAGGLPSRLSRRELTPEPRRPVPPPVDPGLSQPDPLPPIPLAPLSAMAPAAADGMLGLGTVTAPQSMRSSGPVVELVIEERQESEARDARDADLDVPTPLPQNLPPPTSMLSSGVELGQAPDPPSQPPSQPPSLRPSQSPSRPPSQPSVPRPSTPAVAAAPGPRTPSPLLPKTDIVAPPAIDSPEFDEADTLQASRRTPSPLAIGPSAKTLRAFERMVTLLPSSPDSKVAPRLAPRSLSTTLPDGRGTATSLGPSRWPLTPVPVSPSTSASSSAETPILPLRATALSSLPRFTEIPPAEVTRRILVAWALAALLLALLTLLLVGLKTFAAAQRLTVAEVSAVEDGAD